MVYLIHASAAPTAYLDISLLLSLVHDKPQLWLLQWVLFCFSLFSHSFQHLLTLWLLQDKKRSLGVPLVHQASPPSEPLAFALEDLHLSSLSAAPTHHSSQ